MEKFSQWYKRNETNIVWFIIGWLTLAGLQNIVNQSYGWGIFCLAIAFINYKIESWKTARGQ